MAEEQKHAAEQVVEDVPEETSAADNAGVSVAAAAAAAQGTSPVVVQKQQSVAERKARKAMQKKGFEQVTGVNHISVLRKKSPMFSITSPDVYKNAGSDTWIVFGEARVDNFGRMGSAGQRAARGGAPAPRGIDPNALLAEAAPAAQASTSAAAAADEAVDESGVDSSDIDLVVAQANCSRAAAVKALKANSNDVVNAIMDITS